MNEIEAIPCSCGNGQFGPHLPGCERAAYIDEEAYTAQFRADLAYLENRGGEKDVAENGTVRVSSSDGFAERARA